MIVWCVFLFAANVYSFLSREEGLTTIGMQNVNKFKNIAQFGDAQHRGEKWYDLKSTEENSEQSDLDSKLVSSSSSVSSSFISATSSEASSKETKERRKAYLTVRTCTACPHDMLKRHSNLGIKWICGGYQRARRSFKSECMMRYRNCQDGTLFVKLYDHRCQNSSYHGKHWFYVYKV